MDNYDHLSNEQLWEEMYFRMTIMLKTDKEMYREFLKELPWEITTSPDTLQHLNHYNLN